MKSGSGRNPLRVIGNQPRLSRIAVVKYSADNETRKREKYASATTKNGSNKKQIKQNVKKSQTQ